MVPGLRVLALHGPDRARDFPRAPASDLVLTTYPLLWRDADALAAQAWHLLILDEAQMAKNAGSRGARVLRRLRANHLLCLTGTPLENHLGELWTHFDFLMPGFLGNARSFAQRWRKPIEENGETLRAELLARRVRPFILRRRKDDVAPELPPRTTITERVALQGRQRELYEAVRTGADKQVRRVLERQGFEGGLITILDALLKLRQVCCDPRLVKGLPDASGMESAKLDRLAELLPPLVAEGRRVLVFSQFTGMLDLAGQRLDALRLPWLALTGATAPRQRASVVRRFQDPSAEGSAPHPAGQPEGRRHRTEPHGRRYRDPPRPLVESGGDGAGVGPRPPHRPGQARLHPPPGGRRQHRGAHAGTAGTQAGPGGRRAGPRHRRRAEIQRRRPARPAGPLCRSRRAIPWPFRTMVIRAGAVRAGGAQ